eukprot:TRINITY_DN22967_c0_g1_i1.p3 TRINITY_DN22967_c0_g1~~TRINITY_DN22967_c0_g1_i1.p3  ORF type:complete len:108 (-),score=2.45 TRINITY_DN22967_c0_g1_i1:314-637(-)
MQNAYLENTPPSSASSKSPISSACTILLCPRCRAPDSPPLSHSTTTPKSYAENLQAVLIANPSIRPKKLQLPLQTNGKVCHQQPVNQHLHRILQYHLTMLPHIQLYK